MTLSSSIRVAVMAAVLSSAGFGQDRPANHRDGGMSPTDPAAQQQMTRPGDSSGRQAPGYSEEVPNRALSGNTPETNSTLQQDGKEGNTGFELGWLGLLGLAGLFGIGRGSANMRRAPGNDQHTHDMHSRP